MAKSIKDLAREFAREPDNTHSPEEIEEALSAFIDPDQSDMELVAFFNHLILMAFFSRFNSRQQTDYERQIIGKLQKLFSAVENASIFNERQLGHQLSEPCIPGLLGYILALRINSNTVVEEVSREETKLEKEAIEELMKMVGYDPERGNGTFTSGGTLANMTALAVAREVTEKKLREKGCIPGKMCVLTSPFAHYSIKKACGLLGGPNGLIEYRKVGSDELRMDIADLKQKIKRAEKEMVPIMAVLAIAGETETGLVDPLNKIADITEEHGINLIVDGAYGAPYRVSRQGQLFKGMERAMAVSIDPHKALYTPYNNGAVLFKENENYALLNREITADYLQYKKGYRQRLYNLKNKKGSLGEKRIEGSMSAGPILSTLAVLRTLDVRGLTTIYDLTLDRIQHLFNRIAQSQYLQPIHEPDLNLLCFTLNKFARDQLAIKANADLGVFIDATRKELDNSPNRECRYFISATNLPIDNRRKVWAYRACIMHPRTTDEIIDHAIFCLEKIIEKRTKER